MTATAIPGDKEQAVIGAAIAARRQCICQDEDGGPCVCGVPVTREQVGRLRAFAVRHPELAFIFSEVAGEWMSALRVFLPSGADDAGRAAAWMADPFGLPAGADLRHAADLGGLLDILGAARAENLIHPGGATMWVSCGRISWFLPEGLARCGIMIGRAASTGLFECDERVRVTAAACGERPGQGRGDPGAASSDLGPAAAAGYDPAAVPPR